MSADVSLGRFGVDPPEEDKPRPRARGWGNWVPIRTLAERHRHVIEAHLLQLSAEDRYLRFGVTTSDAQIQRYVQSLDFENDELFGIFNRRLKLIAMAHVAYARPGEQNARPSLAEFGVSVLTEARGKGFGDRLFQHAILHARNRGVETLLIHALTENAAMLKIAMRAGATLEYEGPDAEARLKLPADTVTTHLDETWREGLAELNYRAKVQARRLANWLRRRKGG